MLPAPHGDGADPRRHLRGNLSAPATTGLHRIGNVVHPEALDEFRQLLIPPRGGRAGE